MSRRSLYKFMLLGCASSLVQFLPVTAHAASTQVAAAPALEEIVVSAQKRKENLQSVPIVITAITASAARDAGITSTKDLTSIAPGLQYNTQANAAMIFLRGVGTDNTTTGVEDSVAVFVDGVYLPVLNTLLFSFNNIQQIDVLKGPQGTLFGRNADAGVIDITTRDPSQTPHVEASVGYGNYNTLTADLYATRGITPKVAADIALHFSDQMDGWGKNLVTDEDVNKTQDIAARSKWVIKPSDSTKATFIVNYTNERSSNGVSYRGAPTTQLISGPPGFPGGFYDVNSRIDPQTHSFQAGASGKIEQDFGFARLVSITAYQVDRDPVIFDNDGSPSGFEVAQERISNQFFTQELQLLSPIDSKLKWIVGAYYLHGHSSLNPLQITGAAVGPLGFENIFGTQATNSEAEFAQATYPITDKTNLTVGGRYTVDHRRYYGETAIGPTGPIGFVVDGPINKSQTNGRPTWRLAVDHHFNDNVMGYVSYSRGFKSGFFTLANPDNPKIGPETLDDYEIGTKTDLLDRRLRLDAAAFYYRYKGLQLTQYTQTGGAGGLLPVVENAARATIDGLDLDATVAATDRLAIHGGMEWLHSEFTKFEDAPISTPAPVGNAIVPGSATGKQLEQAPELTFDIGAKYIIPSSVGDFTTNVDYYYNGGFYWAPDNRAKQSSYNTLNAQVSWTPVSGPYKVRLWAKNLTGAEYYTQYTEQGLGDTVVAGDPRTFGVNFDLSF